MALMGIARSLADESALLVGAGQGLNVHDCLRYVANQAFCSNMRQMPRVATGLSLDSGALPLGWFAYEQYPLWF